MGQCMVQLTQQVNAQAEEGCSKEAPDPPQSQPDAPVTSSSWRWGLHATLCTSCRPCAVGTVTAGAVPARVSHSSSAKSSPEAGGQQGRQFECASGSSQRNCGMPSCRRDKRGKHGKHEAWEAYRTIRITQHNDRRLCLAGGHSPTLASSAALSGHQHTSSTVSSCPSNRCSACSRVPAPAALLLLLPLRAAAKLVLCDSRSHNSTCRGDGRRDHSCVRSGVSPQNRYENLALQTA